MLKLEASWERGVEKVFDWLDVRSWVFIPDKKWVGEKGKVVREDSPTSGLPWRGQLRQEFNGRRYEKSLTYKRRTVKLGSAMEFA
ncbi:MAG: hypothetical protein D6813_14740 [Calditrichaeota bacterium]|nr:MAG: hypothetical protein D6813_14740 [Calditrichota bacterium]